MDTRFKKFFNLEIDPFGETPDTKFFFESSSHTEALAQLLRLVQQGKGFGLLTGEVGMGKTLLSRMLLKSLGNSVSTALVLFPKLGDCELLQAICEEFEIVIPRATEGVQTLKNYLNHLNNFLLQEWSQGRRCVLVIDEAQGLSTQALEAIRLLSNLETEREKLLQIVILGQPELRDRLAKAELRQFAQRIAVSTEINPLNSLQTERYIRHRLHTAGNSNLIRFEPKAVRLIHEVANGVPRNINRICDKILCAAFDRKVRLIDYAFTKAVLGTRSANIISRFFKRRPLSPESLA